MTTEEKAKAYDEAVEKIAILLGKNGVVIGRYWLEKIFPQLAESEDERIRRELINFVTKVKDIAKSGRDSWAVRKEDIEMCERFLAYLEKQKEQKPSSYSNLEITNVVRKALQECEDFRNYRADVYAARVGATVETLLQEQKPAEWSEEDEKIWNDIFELCDRFGYDDACNKLKSLRPQPHWKPSEEQMDALANIVGYYKNIDRGYIESLYNDLKKLI